MVAVLFFSSAAASARHHHGHADGGPADRDEMDEPAADGGMPPSTGAMEPDDGADDDGGVPVVPRTAAQAEHRDALVAKEREMVRGAAHHGGKKKISQRERQAIGMHWRYVMRLSRIRELAEQDHDTAVVAHVDALNERAPTRSSARGWTKSRLWPPAWTGVHDEPSSRWLTLIAVDRCPASLAEESSRRRRPRTGTEDPAA